MNKSVLIVGKDLPEGNDFADGAEAKSRRVAITQNHIQNAKSTGAANMKALSWLRTSPVSARTLILNCETAFERLDETVLYFDESYYAGKFSAFTTQECSAAVDEMILGFQYLTLEILSRFEKRSSLNLNSTRTALPPKLIFIIKEAINEYEVKKKPALRSLVPMASGPFVASATAAFKAFAENTASIYNTREYVDIFLIQTGLDNEASKNDRAIAEWLCSYMDEFDLLKKKPSLKQSLAWIKVGTKASGFSLFK